MYNDNNNYQNGYSFSTDPNQNSGYTQQYGGYPQPPKPPKKKKVSGGLIAGLLAAAIAVGGLSGFGGSYIANRLEGNSGAQSEESKNPDSTSPEDETLPDANTAPEYSRPEESVGDDLSSLANMAEVNTKTKYDCEELYRRVNESVVMVYNYVNDGYGGENSYVKQGSGSGVFFTTDGYIVTNNHVVKGAAKVTIVVSDKATNYEEVEMDVTLVGTDSSTDLAVLKAERSEPFTAAAIGDSSKLNVGQQVCVIGNPSGLSKSLSTGIVSGLNRFADSNGYELSSIQTDAAINPGNSGGGLFDMYGNLVGVVNSKLISMSSTATIENLGFAITINEAKPIISDLISYGYITGRPIIGISTQKVSSYDSQYTGLLVAEIDQNAPVAKSRLRIGDIITEVNGNAVADVTDVQKATKGMKEGDKVTLTVQRPTTTGNGYFAQTTYEKMQFEVTLTENKGN